jgi:hypothetical protein
MTNRTKVEIELITNMCKGIRRNLNSCLGLTIFGQKISNLILIFAWFIANL